MKISYLQFTLFVHFSCWSCQNPEDWGMQESLLQAGENRSELEHVINHYEQDHDSRKQKAATFLICNIQYHSTSTSREMERYYELMDSISQLTPTRWSNSSEQDLLFNALESPFDMPLERL